MAGTSQTEVGDGPGGLSWAAFKSMSADVGGWLWGTAQGAFNERASTSQILTDAVIGLIPVAGDVTAARDLCAVVLGMMDDPEKRESKWEWMLLVVLLFALIPVLGGIVKGAGRLLIKGARALEAMAPATRAAYLLGLGQDLVAWLNRVGIGNAEKFLLELDLYSHLHGIVGAFNTLLRTFEDVLEHAKRKMGWLMPQGVLNRLRNVIDKLAALRSKGASMIPQALKDLDQTLREVQAYIRSGGETTSRLAAHEISVGEVMVTRTDEARLVDKAGLPRRSVRGGWEKNKAIADHPQSYADVYQHEPGYPDLTKKQAKDGSLPNIRAYSGRIINRELKPGEQIYRYFGPVGSTRGKTVGPTFAGGAWWGLGPPPATAKQWREGSAVLDEWNRDGFVVFATVPDGARPKARVGVIAEQVGDKIAGQYLPGGAHQAFVEFELSLTEELSRLGRTYASDGKPDKYIDPATGIEFIIRRTGWTDANGIYGYLHMPGPATVATARLGAREMATKETREAYE